MLIFLLFSLLLGTIHDFICYFKIRMEKNVSLLLCYSFQVNGVLNKSKNIW